MKKDFLTILDLSGDELKALLKRASEFKSGGHTSACPLKERRSKIRQGSCQDIFMAW
ncbi:MAG: hypothetical protein HY758_02890 [Nitrospirae bacterium]|nr:hypothetical protein [Nitrospirota bacterium]